MITSWLWNLLALVLWPLWWLQRRSLRRRATWLHLRLDRRIVELPPLRPWWQGWLAGASPGPIVLQELRDVAPHLGDDPAVQGLVIEIPHTLHAGWTCLVGVRAWIQALRRGGKRIVAYLPDGGGLREMFVASAADTIWMGPEATVSMLGVASETMYVRPLLERLGVSVEVHAAGRFKTAAESFVAEEMSEPQREQRTALLQTLQDSVTAALRQDRGFDEATIARLFEGVMFRGRAAIEAKLVDDVCHRDQVASKLVADSTVAGEPVARPRPMPSFAAYRRVVAQPLLRDWWPRPYVAIVPVHGTITLAASPQATGASVASITTALDAVRRDPRARAVVLHINSPGGSALASDHIHRDVQRLADEKPVIACFADVAASGGYYIAAPARMIVAQPVTITGSIGVIAAKVVLQGLFERMGLRPQTLRTTAHADMFSPARRLDEAERVVMERESQGTYRRFLDVVAAGRRKSVEEIEPLAAGRVWSGRDALDHGLIDALGGLDSALSEARGLLGDLPASQRRQIPARVVYGRARVRTALPTVSLSNALAAWLCRVAPEFAPWLVGDFAAERTLLFDPSLCEWSRDG